VCFLTIKSPKEKSDSAIFPLRLKEMLNSEESKLEVKEEEMTKKKKKTGVKRVKPKLPKRKTRKRKKR
jgi:hypothetical protein